MDCERWSFEMRKRSEVGVCIFSNMVLLIVVVDAPFQSSLGDIFLDEMLSKIAYLW